MERRASSPVHNADRQRSIHLDHPKKQNAEIAEYASKKKLGVLCALGGKCLSYSSSSFTSPRSAFAFSMIFSCSCAGTTS
jgi:hypothetical protein